MNKRIARISSIVSLSLSMLLLGSHSLQSADVYEEGDVMYVWDRSGIVVYDSYAESRDSIGYIPFGGKASIEEVTSAKINLTGASGRANVVDSYIMYGKWIKISFGEKTIGFIPDQFVLRYEPFCEDDGFENESCLFKPIDVDTLFKNPVYLDGEGLNLKVVTQYRYDVEAIRYEGGVWNEEEFFVPSCSIEEAFVLFGLGSTNSGSHLGLMQNQSDGLALSDDGICTVDLIKTEYGVKITWFCSC